MTTAAPQVQDQILDGIRQSQHAVVEAVRAWSEATATLAPPAPELPVVPQPVDLPTPQELLAGSFDFAEKLLATQREFAEELLAATAAKA
jgi:hypothetical protein